MRIDNVQAREYYIRQRPHSGKFCYGKTPYQTFLDSVHLAKEKQLDAQFPAADTAGNAPLDAAVEGGFTAGADDAELPPYLQFLSQKIQ